MVVKVQEACDVMTVCVTSTPTGTENSTKDDT